MSHAYFHRDTLKYITPFKIFDALFLVMKYIYCILVLFMCEEVFGQTDNEPCKIANINILGTVCRQQCAIAVAAYAICGESTINAGVKLSCCWAARNLPARVS
ncbi:hypothetical protein FQA39_LY17884 [Lamprigera yunnana]|nr:hypothetical protein FQA39_LY17884 [Lamprigera yunnana]